MSSRPILLAFLGIALLQMSYAGKLRAHSTTHQWANIVELDSDVSDAISDLVDIQDSIAQLTLAPAVNCYTGDDSNHASFGSAVGQFGTSDFSVDLWIKTTESTIPRFDVLGNRFLGGHSSFFAIRMTGNHPTLGQGRVGVEIDQDTAGTNYIFITSSKNGYNDGNWHHLAVVRQGTSLYLYVDGTLSSQGSASGVANVTGAYDFRIGRTVDPSADSNRLTAAACYSGPRVERRAWTASEIATKYSTTHP